MPTADPVKTLTQEHQLITSLVELMQQEQRHLVGADIDGLNALTPQKSQLINELGALSAQRHHAVGANRGDAAEAGMRAWLDNYNDPDASALWHELLQLTRQAKELNRVNGMLINKHLAYNQTVLTALRTPAASSENGFYGPSGQAVSAGASRRYIVG